MKKKLIIFSLVLGLLLTASIALAKNNGNKGNNGKKNKAVTQTVKKIDNGNFLNHFKLLPVEDVDNQFIYDYDYENADVMIKYKSIMNNFKGIVKASGLKPGFTYQVKLVGTPACAGGNDATNELIGYAGRWYSAGENKDDAYYQANELKPLAERECIHGYLPFDYFTTDEFGKIQTNVVSDISYHVLQCSNPPGLYNVDTNQAPFWGEELNCTEPKLCMASNVYPQIERPEFTELSAGIYEDIQIVLTEESFHQYACGTWATVLSNDINFEIKTETGNQNENQNGHRVSEHVDLFEKDSSDWSIVDPGAWGKLNYSEQDAGFGFVFNGHKLKAETEYTLISYKEDWPGCGSVELGTAFSNKGGNVHIAGDMDYVLNDYPYGFSGDYEGVSGAKIWLVPTVELGTDNCFVNGWNPDEYLFEDELIYTTPYEYLNHLNLFEKDSSDWSIVVDGANGLLSYDEYFLFEGKGLVDGVDYTLISYKEDWPGCDSVELGTGIAEVDGTVEISGMMDYLLNDYPYGFSGDYEGISGAKIWLVPTVELGTDNCFVNGWNPDEYLFEDELIYETPNNYTLLNLVAKDSNWNILVDGAYGKFHYRENTDFLFEGVDLVDGVDYTLLSYQEDWPGIGSKVLGTETTDANGYMQIKSELENLIMNTYTSGEYVGQTGAKIWLVPSSKIITVNGFVTNFGWTPLEFLFETELILE